MKTLLFLFTLLSINCFSQGLMGLSEKEYKEIFRLNLDSTVITFDNNKFTKLFDEADEAFLKEAELASIKAAEEADSIFGIKEQPYFYKSIWLSCISSSKKQNILLSEDEALNLYLDGYMGGQLSYYYKKDFNYNHAFSTLKKIKRNLRKTRSRNQTFKKKEKFNTF